MITPHYSKLIIGNNAISMPIVCDDGMIRTVRLETYTDGIHVFLNFDGDYYTNHQGYLTSVKAIHAAAAFVKP